MYYTDRMQSTKNNQELQKAIIALLESHRNTGLPFKVILHSFPQEQIHRTSLRRTLDAMCSEGILKLVRKHYSISPRVTRTEVKERGSTLRGKIGVGKGQQILFTPLDLTDPLKIYPENQGHAIPGDTVDVALIRKGANRPHTAKVIRIVKRPNKPVLLEIRGNRIRPRLPLPLPVKIDGEQPADGWYQAHTLDEIHPGYILAKVTAPVKSQHDLDWLELVEQFDLPHQFSKAVLKDAEGPFVDDIPRIDLSQDFSFTIDGEDARDFDDAITLVEKEEGYLLSVHIADVAFHVRPGTELDKEALLRGTSVYFPGYVIPMLPENLSNNLCSLVPNQKRKTLTCEMLISKRGSVLKASVYPSMICSKRRFTYNEVQDILDLRPQDPQHSLLKTAHALFLILLSQRKKSGAIDFDMPEHKLVLKANGDVSDVIKVERLDSMRIIEEFMLIANQTVARFLFQLKIPATYRNHPAPVKEKVRILTEVLRSVKINHSLKDSQDPKCWQALMDSIPDELRSFVQPLVLRTMQQAIYSIEDSTHFGLAKQFYCHFTSPIRRYPDLVVHRQLHRLFANSSEVRLTAQPLDKKLSKSARFNTPEDLAHTALKCSRRERKAMEAEREYLQRKKAEFLKPQIGKDFMATVTGVTSRGLYAELESWPIEGFLGFEALPGRWVFQEDTQTAVTRQGQSIRMGFKLKVKIRSVDVLKARIDLDYQSGLVFTPKKQSFNS